MKRTLLLLSGCLLSLASYAQAAAVALDKTPKPLTERYQLMKANSQTFQDYKVIKEYILDGVWKISMDTIAALDQRIHQANQQIALLKNDVAEVKKELETHKKSVAQIEFDSTHINFIGISLTKNLFRVLVFIVLGTLIGIIFFITGHWKLSRMKMKEHMLMTDLISREFDDFKKKALEKQVKLSRQLQDERNKLATMIRDNP